MSLKSKIIKKICDWYIREIYLMDIIEYMIAHQETIIWWYILWDSEWDIGRILLSSYIQQISGIFDWTILKEQSESNIESIAMILKIK